MTSPTNRQLPDQEDVLHHLDDPAAEEDMKNPEVQRLAAALSPQLKELEDILDDPFLLLQTQPPTTTTTSPSQQQAALNHNNNNNNNNRASSSSGVVSKMVSDDDDIVYANNNNNNSSSTSNNPFHDPPPARTTGPMDTNNPFQDPPPPPPPPHNHQDYDYDGMDEDDDMDHEIEQLGFAEDQLRQELTLAEDFASFFGSSPLVVGDSGGGKKNPSVLNLNFNLSSFTPATLFQGEEDAVPAPATTVVEDIHQEQPPISMLSMMDASHPSQTQMGEADVDEDADGTAEEEMEPSILHASQHEDTSKKESSAALDMTSLSQVPPLAKTPTPASPAALEIAKSGGSQDSNNPFKDDSNIPAVDAPTTPQTPAATPSSHLKTPTPRRRRSSPGQSYQNTPQTSIVLFKSPAPDPSYTSQEHFQRLQLRKEPQGAWYSVDLTSHLMDPGMTLPPTTTTPSCRTVGATASLFRETQQAVLGLGMKEYCLSITQWKRLFAGLKLEEDEETKKQKQHNSATSPTQTSTKPVPATPTPSSSSSSSDSPIITAPPVRTISIRIRPDVLCGAVMDAVTQALVNYDSPQQQQQQHSNKASIMKRQGGHLLGTVTGVIPVTPKHHSRRRRRRSSFGTSSEAPRDCTFLVDAQLCTHKSDDCERVLLLRIYHWGKEERAKTTEDDLWSPSGNSTTTTTTTPNHQNDDDSFLRALEDESSTTSSVLTQKDQQANWHLREACALIQRIESPELARKIRPLVRKAHPPAGKDVNGVKDVVSEHLLQNYRACPSVRRPDTAVTLPALSPQDWPVIQASWAWIHSVWDELETRELTYLSLLGLHFPCLDETGLETTSPPIPRFGGFPALPTLDVQYCSQLRRLSREAMIAQLLKAASVLEEYARQAEYQCANLIDMLRPTFHQYGTQPPALPKPAPLAAYPLEYSPPQALCPPWGMKVMEALNQVAAMSHAANQAMTTSAESSAPPTSPQMEAGVTVEGGLDSIALAETAVEMLYSAFQQQDDEEQSARLARKNLQVMDRLSNMQKHNRASILALSACANSQATAAGDDFFAKAKNAIVGLVARRQPSEQGSTDDMHTKPWREVPLIKVNLGVGGASGTCTITANQLLFTPAKYSSFIGRSQSTWFCLQDVEYSISQSEPTLLNPLSTTIHVLERSSGLEVFAFKPSSSAPRLKSFLDIAQKESIESK